MAQRPNLIICMCDELRAFEVGCYGHPHIRTPHIDAMAERGTRFEHGVSNCPVCMPARSVVLSGQYARTCCGTLTNVGWPGGASFSHVGFPQWPTGKRNHLKDPTLPELLRGAGYDTMAIGKWHIEAWPDHVGFDHYMIPAHHHAHVGQWFIEDGSMPFSHDGYSVEFELQRVQRHLAQRAGGDEPFFLYYNISPPHMPLAEAPAKYLDMYCDADVISRPNVDLTDEPKWQKHHYLTYLWDYRFYRDHLPHTWQSPQGLNLQRLTAMYMGLTTWVDDTVGQLFASLEQQGLADNTLVVFCADHGDNFGSHRRLGKGQLNEESIRVPLIFAGPGVVTRPVDRQVGSLIDLAPTLARFAGLDVPTHMAGQDLCPILTGRRDQLEQDYAIIEAVGEGLAIRTPTHTYGLPWKNQPQLGDEPVWYTDLREDPYQLHRTGCADHQRGTHLHETLTNWDNATPWRNAD